MFYVGSEFMNLVIVESPAKAKTINKYLGDNYKVLASYGHIRDLPSKNGSVDPEQDFKMEWEVDSFSKKYLKEITDAAKDSSKIILATDPDREGEAIAWHVKEYLNEKKLLKDKEIERVVFNEITKKAVIKGIENPRQIEPHLVDAYMARRALDYLVGFNISPILWTKLPGSKSAGRVQSVALKLITEREHEIESFKPEEFWTLSVNFIDQNKLWPGEDWGSRLQQEWDRNNYTKAHYPILGCSAWANDEPPINDSIRKNKLWYISQHQGSHFQDLDYWDLHGSQTPSICSGARMSDELCSVCVANCTPTAAAVQEDPDRAALDQEECEENCRKEKWI